MGLPPSPPGGLQRSLEYIRTKAPFRPEIGLVLGSGLGDLAESLESPVAIDTRSIPEYPHSGVEGHKGRLVFSRHAGVPLLAFQGRVHLYESGNIEGPLHPIRVAHGLGVGSLIVTNAAGGINPVFEAGDLMLITDHLNLTSESIPGNLDHSKSLNPLYDKGLIKLAEAVSRDLNIHLWKGVYAGVKGPSYETAAEVQMIKRIGGDAVGMSTVLEVSLARVLGLRVLGISCITNKATGIGAEKLSHEEVNVAAATARNAFATLVLGVIARWRERERAISA